MSERPDRDGSDVLWEEGMLLLPHHLQALRRWFLQRVAWVSRRASPYPWGVSELSIVIESDPEQSRQLLPLRLRIRECDLTFPDGTRLVSPGNARLDPLSLPERPSGENFDVFVLIPNERPDGPNLVEREDVDRRWCRDFLELADENEGPDGLSARVGVRRLNARLWAGTGAPGPGFQALRVATFCHEGTPEPRLVEDRPPPLLRVEASSALARTCALLVEDLDRVRSELRTIEPLLAGTSAHPELLARRQAVESHTARLHALLATPGLHPYQLAMELTGAAASVLALSAAPDPPTMPVEAYAHDRPGERLHSLVQAIRSSLPFFRGLRRPFHRVDQHTRRANLEPQLIESGCRVCLALSKSGPPEPSPTLASLRFSSESDRDYSHHGRESGFPLARWDERDPWMLASVDWVFYAATIPRVQDGQNPGRFLYLETRRKAVTDQLGDCWLYFLFPQGG